MEALLHTNYHRNHAFNSEMSNKSVKPFVDTLDPARFPSDLFMGFS
jgi:hypothetical protein